LPRSLVDLRDSPSSPSDVTWIRNLYSDTRYEIRNRFILKDAAMFV
jgi:hypothetical protein